MAPAPAAASPAPAADDPGVAYIKSPMVGTFYRIVLPGQSALCRGQPTDRESSIVCIVEAMKIMNEIQAEVKGVILEVLVESGQPVEYGQRLFRVKTDLIRTNLQTTSLQGISDGGRTASLTQSSPSMQKILIANRGEIALRIVRACRELGIKTFAVYSEPDIESLHVQLADEAICIGPGPRRNELPQGRPPPRRRKETPMSMPSIPGYGFLSENTDFAEQCESCNIKFIGPQVGLHPQDGRQGSGQGNRPRSRRNPIVPEATDRSNRSAAASKPPARSVYPVIIKAVAGGGERGMRIAHNDVSFPRNSMLPGARRRRPSVTDRSTWRNTSRIRVTLNFRFWPTPTGKCSTSESGTVPSSAGTGELSASGAGAGRNSPALRGGALSRGSRPESEIQCDADPGCISPRRPIRHRRPSPPRPGQHGIPWRS